MIGANARPPRNGDVSFWYADIGVPIRRPALERGIAADICIVGGGFTGLWTAYYLKKATPALSIVVLEREFAGFGASGRNGGNLTGRFPWERSAYLRHATPDRLLAMEVALNRTVDEVIGVVRTEGIDADICQAGNLSVATTPAQQARQKVILAEIQLSTPDDADAPRLLTRDELMARVRVEGGLSAIYNPNSARVQPAKLVRGLSDIVERMGVSIYEDTAVEAIDGRHVRTSSGAVRAETVVRATEGFTSRLPGHDGTLIPLNSAIIVTEPLSPDTWRRIGWDGYETVSETSYAYSYCQHTREGRITVGGRGVPYRFGSGIDLHGRTQQKTIEHLLHDLRRLFPEASTARVDHAWCGVLGVPRDWCASVGFDKAAGQAWAGGYVGAGLAASNLAGRTLRDLILGCESELSTFPWVNHRARRWEPEPVRWLGIHATYLLYGLADHDERRGRTTGSPYARLANALAGRT